MNFPARPGGKRPRRAPLRLTEPGAAALSAEATRMAAAARLVTSLVAPQAEGAGRKARPA